MERDMLERVTSDRLRGVEADLRKRAADNPQRADVDGSSFLAWADTIAAHLTSVSITDTSACALCGELSRDGDWYRICGACRWSDMDR